MALKIQLHCANLQTERQPHEVMTCADFGGGDCDQRYTVSEVLEYCFLGKFQSVTGKNQRKSILV